MCVCVSEHIEWTRPGSTDDDKNRKSDAELALVLDEGWHFVYGGDACDKGHGTLRFLQVWLSCQISLLCLALLCLVALFSGAFVCRHVLIGWCADDGDAQEAVPRSGASSHGKQRHQQDPMDGRWSAHSVSID